MFTVNSRVQQIKDPYSYPFERVHLQQASSYSDVTFDWGNEKYSVHTVRMRMKYWWTGLGLFVVSELG